MSLPALVALAGALAAAAATGPLAGRCVRELRAWLVPWTAGTLGSSPGMFRVIRYGAQRIGIAAIGNLSARPFSTAWPSASAHVGARLVARVRDGPRWRAADGGPDLVRCR